MGAPVYKAPVSIAPPFLFDLDGTLADTIADIAASTNHVRGSHGLPALTLATVQSFVGHGAATLLHRALPELGYGEQDPRWREVQARYGEHHAQACTQTARLYPGVLHHLRTLRAAGHPLAVVTNKPERFARQLTAHLGLDPLLRAVLGGDSLPQRKPDPAPLLEALRRCGAGPAGATMVGDGETDLRAGKSAGLRTIACLYGYRPPELLRREGADVYWHRFGGP